VGVARDEYAAENKKSSLNTHKDDVSRGSTLLRGKIRLLSCLRQVALVKWRWFRLAPFIQGFQLHPALWKSRTPLLVRQQDINL